MNKKQLQSQLESAARRVIAGESIDILKDAIMDIDALNRLSIKRKRRETEFKARQLGAFQTNASTEGNQ
jgi:hypothetical protein